MSSLWGTWADITRSETAFRPSDAQQNYWSSSLLQQAHVAAQIAAQRERGVNQELWAQLVNSLINPPLVRKWPTYLDLPSGV